MKRLSVILLSGLAAASLARAGQTDVSKFVGRQTPPQVLDGTSKLVGHYNPNQMLRLVFGLQPPHMAEEEQFLEELHTKGSPNFHHFLTAEEWDSRFAPSAEDEQAVVDWAQSAGFTVTHRFPNRLLVDVEAPVATIEKALAVTMNSYQLGATTFFSNDRDPAIPASLAGIVHSIGGLNNLQVLHPANKAAQEPVFPVYGPGPVAAMGPSGGVSGNGAKAPRSLKGSQNKGLIPNITSGAYDPTDMYDSEAYDANALYAQGHCCNPLGNPNVTPPETSIAIATAGRQNTNDIQGFLNQYPYLAAHYHLYYIDGTPACCDGEGTMDLEWSTAMSNSFGSYVDTAMVYMYDGVNAYLSTFTDIYNQILSDGKARVFSTSWGCAEIDCYSTSVMDSNHAIFNSMVGQGWTLVGISHDGGATTSCVHHDAVSYPGSDPDVVASGGTTLSLSAGPIYNSEVAWTGGPDGCSTNDGGSGGGVSAYWAAPSYQNVTGNRQVPDVALNADWYYTPQNIYYGGGLSGNGGTSIVAPEVAGFMANANAYLLSLGNICGSGGSSPCAPIGNANYLLYLAAASPHDPFYDITSGCNNNNITALYGLGYYCAGVGRDLVTGWGSFNMLQLAWAFNWWHVPGFTLPTVTFSGPATSHWYNTDQVVSWTVTAPPQNGFPSDGVAGFSQAWDSDPGDVYSEATPGTGNSFYSGPQYANATTGCLDFTGASCAGSVGQGWHTVNVRAWGNEGEGSGDVTYGPIGYDTIRPTISLALSSAPNAAGWFKNTVTVTLSASDPGTGSTGSGVAATYYGVDAPGCSTRSVAGCAVYGSPFSITTEGRHAVQFFTQDVAGNFSGAQPGVPVNIDKTAPHTRAMVTGNVRVGLIATDNLSGVASTVYQIDGGGVTTYTLPFIVLAKGAHTVTFHSTDRAGNVEATQTVNFTVH